MSCAAIDDFVIPVRTVDPDTNDLSDLADALGEVIGDAQVVCLGENVHGGAQLYQLRHRMLRVLVQHFGFTAFVWESGLPEGLAVNRWIHDGQGAITDVARDGITWGLGRCKEMHTQLCWMRDNNTSAAHPVNFYGMDIPGWGVDPGAAVAACLARLPAQPGDDELLARADMGPVVAAPTAKGATTADVSAQLRQGIAQLVDRAERAANNTALQCARGASQVVDFLTDGLYPAPGRNFRNEVMADNIRWILEREDRIFVSAHNVHLQRTASFDGTAPIGMLLADDLGDATVIIGTTRGAGPVPDIDLTAPPAQRFANAVAELPPPPPHTLDALLDTAGALHLTDLRRVPETLLAPVTAMYGQHALIDIDPSRSFDAAIHLRNISPVTGVDDLLQTTG